VKNADAPATPVWFIAGERLARELDRVGVSLRTAGVHFGVTVTELGQEIAILGPQLLRQSRSWRGTHWGALKLLEQLPDDAGTNSFWALFDPKGRRANSL
jgi:hypothetical protein